MEKLDRLDSIPNAFIGQIERLLPEVYQQLISRTSLKIVNGKIARTRENANLIYQIIDEWSAAILDENSPYIKAVKGYMRETRIQKDINAKLLEKFGTLPEASEAVYAASRRQTLNLLVGDGFRTNFVEVIRGVMIENMTSAATFADMSKAIFQRVVGESITTKDGTRITNSQLLNWSKQIAHDRFAITDRVVVQAAADEYNVQWFRYVGGLIEDSREFCVERDGQLYHRSQIEAWPDTAGEWAGRMKGTDSQTIFSFCGGYRCNHALIPQATSSVPEELRKQFE